MPASKLKTSKRAGEFIRSLSRRLDLTPNLVCRLALGRSLGQGVVGASPPADAGGIEFNRYTLTGEFDLLFKLLMVQAEGRSLSDAEFFETVLPAHLERGAELLARDLHRISSREEALRGLVLRCVPPGGQVGRSPTRHRPTAF